MRTAAAKFLLAALTLTLSLTVAHPAIAVPGQPVSSFGVNGVIVDDFGGAGGSVGSVDRDSKGRFVVAVSTFPSRQGPAMVIVRYTTTGARDPSFGTDGVVVLPDAFGGAAVVRPDDSIVVMTGPVSPTITILDEHGSVVERTGGLASEAVGLPDGRVVVNNIGHLFFLDPSNQFEKQVVRGQGGTLRHLTALSDGGILVVSNEDSCSLTRVSPSGVVDPTYGTGGSLTIPGAYTTSPSGRIDGCGTSVLPDGSVLVAHFDGAGPAAWLVDAHGTPTSIPWNFFVPEAMPSLRIIADGAGQLVDVGARVPCRLTTPPIGCYPYLNQLRGVFLDGTTDTSFGSNGFVDFPGELIGAKFLAGGDLIAWGHPTSSGSTVSPPIVLMLISAPFGTAPQWPVLPTTKFVPVAPTRVLDTRLGVGAPAAKVASGSSVELQVAGHGGVPATGVEAVVLNVTATDNEGPGFVTVYPSDEPRPWVSNLNFDGANQTAPNLVVVQASARGSVSLFTQTTTNLVADVAGYYTEVFTARDGRFQSTTPTRLLDTRKGLGAPAGLVGADQQIDLQITGNSPVPASGVSAVVLNVTGTEAAGPGYVSVWPAGLERPTASNLNLVANDTRANLVVVPVGAGGKVSLYSQSGTHLIADVAGWFTDSTAPEDSAGLFVPISPVRMLDTRQWFAGPLGAGATFTRRLGASSVLPPYGAVDSVALNATVAAPPGPGFVTLYPSNTPLPEVSNLNVTTSAQVIANAAVVPLNAESLTAYTHAGAHLILDVAGWYTAD